MLYIHNGLLLNCLKKDVMKCMSKHGSRKTSSYVRYPRLRKTNIVCIYLYMATGFKVNDNQATNHRTTTRGRCRVRD